MRLPSWAQSQYDPQNDAVDLLSGLFAYLVLAPFFWLVLPLARVVAELPVALGRSFFSSTRWVEAVCREPSELRIVWRTSRERADEVAEHVTQALGRGYEDVTPPDATFESMTKPVGLDDLTT